MQALNHPVHQRAAQVGHHLSEVIHQRLAHGVDQLPDGACVAALFWRSDAPGTTNAGDACFVVVEHSGRRETVAIERLSPYRQRLTGRARHDALLAMDLA